MVIMGMLDVRYAPKWNVSANCSLTLFFEKVVDALERLRTNRVASLADEARRLCRGTMTRVLTKIAHWHPDLDFGAGLKSLPEGVDTVALNERIQPILSRIDKIKRLEGQRPD